MDYQIADVAAEAYAAFVELRESEHETLDGRAAMEWLRRERFDDAAAPLEIPRDFRSRLAAGGLDLEVERWERFRSAHPVWTRLADRARAGTLTPGERLWFARLLLYLGFFAGAAAMVEPLHHSADATERLGAAWIATLAGQDAPLAAAFAAARDEASPRLRFEVALQLASVIEAAAAAAAFEDPLDRVIAEARTLRLQHKCAEAIALLSNVEDQSPFELRRVLAAICCDEASVDAARLATRLDPTSGRAWLLLARATGRDEAVGALHRARLTGPIERQSAVRELGTVDPRSWVPAAFGSSCDGATDYDAWLRASDAYQRYLSFWELRRPQVPCTLAAQAPAVAWEILHADATPFFESVYLQRAMVMTFREELFYAGVPNVAVAQSHAAVGTSLAALRGRSAETEELFERIDAIGSATALERTRVARLLGALAFYDEARALLRGAVPEDGALDPFEQYLLCTDFFLRNVQELTSPRDYTDLVRRIFARLTPEIETLRLRLLVAIHASVHHGQQRNLDELRHWRGTGMALLEELQVRPEFGDFEKRLLTSRFYRAVSYYPFLTGHRELLLADAEACESNARALDPSSAHQELLKAENLFPMLESMSRVYAFTGDRDRATALMREIVESVDPMDSKAWLQVGELEQKRGRLEQAAEAFVRSGSLGPPASRIAWFRAGAVYERLGDLRQARDAHLASLRHWPRGLTPLTRLYELAKPLGDAMLRAWAHDALTTLHAEKRLRAAQAARVNDLLTAEAR